MKRLLVFIGALGLFACNSDVDAIKERDDAILNAIQARMDRSGKEFNTGETKGLKLLSVDSLTEREYILRCADQFKFKVKMAEEALAMEQSGMPINDTLGSSAATAGEASPETIRRLETEKQQLDSCERAAQQASTEKFYGYLTKVSYSKPGLQSGNSEPRQRHYLVTKDMQVQFYRTEDK